MSYDPPKTKSETCQSCGQVFQRSGGRRRHLCFDCRMARFLANIGQNRQKGGPYWEKTVRGQLAKWKREAEELGIDT